MKKGKALMRRIGMLTSGGDCQSLNATMRGVAKSLYKMFDDIEIVGFEDGYKGLMYADYRIMKQSDFSGILTRGGTILGTSRQPFKLMRTPDENGLDKVEAMKHTYYKLKLECLVILGGNGSQKTANLLREEGLNIVSLPKTIDNDLWGSDLTFGFHSAVDVATNAIDCIHTTAASHGRVFIVEIMGRDAGWLTAASCLARNDYSPAPHLIYLPEVDFDEDQFIEDIKNVLKTSRCVIVAVSEGIHDKDGNYISATSAVADKFGHAQLSGTGKALESLVKDRMDIKVRSIELNVLQRCAAHISSRTDINESFALGQAAVKYAAEGMTAVMSTIKRVSNDPYQWIIEPENVSLIANQAKTIPLEWITPEKNDVTPEMEAYLRPLIIGEVSLQYKDGLPMYLPVNHLL